MSFITINNWKRFLPRQDRDNHVWFRLENSIIWSESLFGLTHEQKWFWICLLAYASKKNSETFEYKAEYFASQFGVSVSAMEEVLEVLSKGSEPAITISDEPTPVGVDAEAAGSPTNKQTDRQTKEVDREETLPRLAEIWNEHCGSLPKVRASNKNRDRKANSRLGEASAEEWAEVVRRLAASNFCVGKNDRGWKATFDFLLQPDTRLKALEGKYDNPVKPFEASKGFVEK